MTATPELPTGSPTAAWLAWALHAGSVAAGAIGFSGLLYAAGFVALRSHMSFWGFWTGSADDTSAMVSEGGRLLYHLAIVFIEMINPLASGTPWWFYALVLATIALWNLPASFSAGATTHRGRAVKALLAGAAASAALLWGLLVLDGLATVLAPSGLLVVEGPIAPALRRMLCQPQEVYLARVVEVAALCALMTIAVWALRLCPAPWLRVLALLDSLMLIGALSLLPAAYGRLVLQPEYPLVEFSRDTAATKGQRVLVRVTGTQWIVWNLDTRRTEVINARADETVSIGPRRLLAPAAHGGSKGVGCAKP